jgi:hypothetical protein
MFSFYSQKNGKITLLTLIAHFRLQFVKFTQNYYHHK